MTTPLTTTHGASSLFVYGTLRPGDVRWHLLEPFVLDDGCDDTVDGSVFDTGRNFPAAIFGTTGVIHGRIYTLRAESATDCLVRLDAEEGTVGGYYRRVQVQTRRGTVAWAYEYGAGLDLTLIASGDWLNR